MSAAESAPRTGAPERRRLGLRVAPYVLWFSTLGGAVAWSLHTLFVWSIDETTCRSHHDSIGPVPVRPLLGGITVVFLAIGIASLVTSYRHWQRFRDAEGDDLPAHRRQRGAFMGLVGLVLNVLCVVMIVMVGVAILVLPVCAPTP